MYLINNITRKYFKNCEGNIVKLDDLTIKLTSRAKHIVDPVGNTKEEGIKPKIVWKYEMYNEISLHRVIDFTYNFSKSWNDEFIGVCYNSVRSIYENTAYVYDMQIRIQKLIDAEKYEDINDLINNRIFGTTLKDDFPDITKIMSVIDTVTKDFPPFRDTYERLSQYCHPNYSAMMGLYTSLDNYPSATINRVLGLSESNLNILLNSLLPCLTIYDLSLDNVDKIYPVMCKIFNERFEKG